VVACARPDATTLTVLGGSELSDLKLILDDVAKSSGIRLDLKYSGTLDGTEVLLSGVARPDLVWFSSDRYLRLQDGLKGRLPASEKIMLSPVVRGVKASLARKWRWDSGRVSWKDIVQKAASGELQYGMANPAAINSGLSALVGVAAHFLGWLGAWWLPIVLGLYLLGVLLTPVGTRTDRQLAQETRADELGDELNRFVRGLRGNVPPELLSRTQGVATQVQALLLHLGARKAQGDPNAFTVWQAITDYLPGTFRNYLNMPPALRSQASRRLGKSPDAVVAEQLDLLSSTLERVSVDTVEGDADAMQANGRFLKEKFGKPDLEL